MSINLQAAVKIKALTAPNNIPGASWNAPDAGLGAPWNGPPEDPRSCAVTATIRAHHKGNALVVYGEDHSRPANMTAAPAIGWAWSSMQKTPRPASALGRASVKRQRPRLGLILGLGQPPAPNSDDLGPTRLPIIASFFPRPGALAQDSKQSLSLTALQPRGGVGGRPREGQNPLPRIASSFRMLQRVAPLNVGVRV
jgi:hypothetical protein